MEFKALEAYGESFPQFVLQLTIIIKNGLHIFDGEVIKIFSIVSSYITLILTVSGLIVSLPFYIDGKKQIQEKTMKLQYKTVLPKVTFIVTSRLVILCLFLSMFDLDSAWLCSTILAIFVLSYFFLYWILFKLQFRNRLNGQMEVVFQTKFKWQIFNHFNNDIIKEYSTYSLHLHASHFCFLLLHDLLFLPWRLLKSKGRFVNLFGTFSPLCAMV